MIGARARFASLIAAAAIVAMPSLGQQRGLPVLPGSGIVTRTGPPRRRRDAGRLAAAAAKRERKNAKRARDAERAAHGQECARYCLTRGHHGL